MTGRTAGGEGRSLPVKLLGAARLLLRVVQENVAYFMECSFIRGPWCALMIQLSNNPEMCEGNMQTLRVYLGPIRRSRKSYKRPSNNLLIIVCPVEKVAGNRAF